MAKIKLSDVVKCKTNKDLEKLSLTPAGLESVKSALEKGKPEGYKKTVQLIDKYLQSLLDAEPEEEEEEVEIPEEKPEKKPARLTKGGAGKSETAGSEKKPAKKETVKLMGKEYEEVTLTKDEMMAACFPQTSVLVIADEGMKEATVFTAVWVADNYITLVDLSTTAKGAAIMIDTKKFFSKKEMVSETEGFDAKLVALMKEVK